MEINWIALVPLFFMFLVPFLFKIKKFENAEIIDKQTYRSGKFVNYSFVIKVKNKKLTIPVSEEVFHQINKGSIVTLHYNTGEEKAVGYSA